jgi:hypothetical protein
MLGQTPFIKCLWAAWVNHIVDCYKNEMYISWQAFSSHDMSFWNKIETEDHQNKRHGL